MTTKYQKKKKVSLAKCFKQLVNSVKKSTKPHIYLNQLILRLTRMSLSVKIADSHANLKIV